MKNCGDCKWFKWKDKLSETGHGDCQCPFPDVDIPVAYFIEKMGIYQWDGKGCPCWIPKR